MHKCTNLISDQKNWLFLVKVFRFSEPQLDPRQIKCVKGTLDKIGVNDQVIDLDQVIVTLLFVFIKTNIVKHSNIFYLDSNATLIKYFLEYKWDGTPD